MKVNFINPVLKSTMIMFSTMAHIEPKVGAPMMKKNSQPVQGKNITGLMDMIGTKGKASIALTFSEKAILLIANKMMPPDSPTASIDGMVIDLVGELANMVLGGAKSELENEGYLFQLSLPTIIFGSDYLITHKTNAPIIMLPFTMPEGGFFIDASYEEVNE
jgi:chemotaxis protein CheX